MTRVSSAEQPDRVIWLAKDASLDLRDIIVAVKSFWLSSYQRYPARFKDSNRDLAANLAEISALVTDNPIQGKRALEASSPWVGAIQTLIAQRNNQTKPP